MPVRDDMMLISSIIPPPKIIYIVLAIKTILDHTFILGFRNVLVLGIFWNFSFTDFGHFWRQLEFGT